jgi:Ca-activated chloride channel family protein
MLLSPPASADFLDWWFNTEQRALSQYESGEYLDAARRFEDPYRKGLAYYAAEQFAQAAFILEDLATAEAAFYRGNALAQQDRLAEAADAYRQALALRGDFAEAAFNLDWVEGLLEIEGREYDDHGGTGGKLGADDVVFGDRAKRAQSSVTAEELRKEAGLSDAQLEEMWMRRVQTTPGDFLRLKFDYQLISDEDQ